MANIVHAANFFEQFSYKSQEYRFVPSDQHHKEASELLSQALRHAQVVDDLVEHYGTVPVAIAVQHPKACYWWTQLNYYRQELAQVAAAPTTPSEDLAAKPLSSN